MHHQLQGAESVQNCLWMMAKFMAQTVDGGEEAIAMADNEIYSVLAQDLFSEAVPFEKRWVISNSAVRSRYDQEMKKQSLLNEEYKRIWKQKVEYDAIMAA